MPSLPQFILFGDSLTEWAFEEENTGFGWFLENKYRDKVDVRCEGMQSFTSTDLLPDFDRIITQATAPDAPQTLLFTIFLGANDACFFGKEEYVAMPSFEANIRKFVDTILDHEKLRDAKIVLITPPPINILSPLIGGESKVEMQELNKAERKKMGYRTFINKKRYAERVVQIADEYEDTGRVVGLDFWGNLVRTRLSEIEDEYDEDMLPGCGLYGSKDFGEGYFTDGLHLDTKGYHVLSRGLYKSVVSQWPQMAPGLL
ncbi:GDSL-like Lipase/Acylhydrolase [Stagonosporopsis vannaccii]|nr:GDSL-like Lipase/Acylhydrolase [Stagonosporopsis vannaccii]